MGHTTRRWDWQMTLGVLLVLISAALYLIHYAIFRDARHILIYLLGDLAFLPVEVLLVTVIIHRLLVRRERQNLLHKLNMVIGAFYNEAGVGIIERLTPFLTGGEAVTPALVFNANWTDVDFVQARKTFTYNTCWMDSRRGDMTELKQYLVDHRDFLLRLLENPNLLEHDSFTDLLWSVFHLEDELAHRERLSTLTEKDLDHLSGDMKRCFIALISEWLAYINHLRKEYPYLYSIAIRINPFDPNARAEIA